MPTRRKTTLTNFTSDLSFEEAMAELEGIVATMESEELPLGELVARYEAGTALLKHCTSALTAAKKRIELITLTDTGESDSSAGKTPEPSSGDSDEINDISLF